jgi:hypothetical protein
MPMLYLLHCRQRYDFDGAVGQMQEYFTLGNIRLLIITNGKQWTQTVFIKPFKPFISFS